MTEGMIFLWERGALGAINRRSWALGARYTHGGGAERARSSREAAADLAKGARAGFARVMRTINMVLILAAGRLFMPGPNRRRTQ